MPTKNFLQSKTIIGALLIILSVIAPLIGLDFTSADANALTAKFEVFSTVTMELVGAVLVVWGRFSAKTDLTILPGARNRLNSPWWISALLAVAFMLSGCIGAATYRDQTPVEKLRTSYDAALPLITIYTVLPACGPDVAGLCSKPDVVKTLTDASTLVGEYLAQLEAANTLSESDKAAALRAAQNSLRTMLIIYAAQALTKA
jgi:hypothetical protein